MRRNIHYWTRFSLQNLSVPGLFILFGLISGFGWSEGSIDLTMLPWLSLQGMAFGILIFSASVFPLYLPLLVSMGETRHNVLLGYHYYQALLVVMGSTLWGILSILTGTSFGEMAAGLLPAGLLLVIICALSSLIGILYTRYKWVGIAVIALAAGAASGTFTLLMIQGAARNDYTISFLLADTWQWILLLVALGLAVVEVLVFWLHFRRREIRI